MANPVRQKQIEIYHRSMWLCLLAFVAAIPLQLFLSERAQSVCLRDLMLLLPAVPMGVLVLLSVRVSRLVSDEMQRGILVQSLAVGGASTFLLLAATPMLALVGLPTPDPQMLISFMVIATIGTQAVLKMRGGDDAVRWKSGLMLTVAVIFPFVPLCVGFAARLHVFGRAGEPLFFASMIVPLIAVLAMNRA